MQLINYKKTRSEDLILFWNRFLIAIRYFSSDLEKYFEYQGQDYICSRPDDNGMHSCSNLPPLKLGECIFDIQFYWFKSFFFYSLSIGTCLWFPLTYLNMHWHNFGKNIYREMETNEISFGNFWKYRHSMNLENKKSNC